MTIEHYLESKKTIPWIAVKPNVRDVRRIIYGGRKCMTNTH